MLGELFVAMSIVAAGGDIARDRQAKATFFVSVHGNDAWSGRLAAPNAEKTDGPFATLAKARDALRRLKDKPKQPLTVMVRGGKYLLDQTLVLGPEDSGTRESPVTYSAYPGEKPTLSGGRRLTGFRPYRGKILQCDLPAAKGGKWSFRQLFVNGERQIRARAPDFDPAAPLYGGWAFVEGPAKPGSTIAFRYKPDTFVHRWAAPKQGEVNVFPGAGWYNNIIPIASVDEKTRVITLTRNTQLKCAFQAGNRFFVENLLEELDRPGEWCLDTERGIIYFWPPAGSIEGAEIVAPALDCLIDLRGASHVRVSGFTFTETIGGDNFHHEGVLGCGVMSPLPGLRYCGDAVHLSGAQYCIVEDNTFYAVGGTAVYLQGDNVRNVIQRNEINGAGACGVSLAGTKGKSPLHNEITDNHIHHTGVYHKYSAGVFLGLSEGNTVAHNLIEHVPHHAVNLGNLGLVRNIVEYNEIRHAAQESYDTAAINCWMEQPANDQRSGHVIRHNLIADTGGTGPGVGYANGIYLDNWASNCLVYGNIVVRSATIGINVHGGRNNLIENNVFVNSGGSEPILGGGAHVFYQPIPVQHGLPIEFMAHNFFQRNILYNKNPRLLLAWSAGWSDRMGGKSDYNLFFNRGSEKYSVFLQGVAGETISLQQWQKMGYDTHSAIGDPLFVDAEHDDYRLRPESPAWKLGFQQVELSRIGIRKGPPP